MTEHFLVLGAGASLGARDGPQWPQECRPPLGARLASYLLRWLDANGSDEPGAEQKRRNHCNASTPSNEPWSDAEFLAGLKAFLEEARDTDFERATSKLVDRFGEPDSHWVRFPRINRTIAFSMLVGQGCAFPRAEGGDLYDELLDVLRWNETSSLTVVSFNYDILFEEAVARRLGTRKLVEAVRYPDLRLIHPTNSGALRLYKPHGSINWLVVDTSSAVGHDLEVLRNQVRPAGTSWHDGKPIGGESGQDYVSQGGREGLVLDFKQSHSTKRPVMALYGPGKPVPENALGIDQVRRGCLDAIRSCPDADVTVVGLHIPPAAGDDPVLEELLPLLGGLSGTRRYVSPCAEDCASAAELGLNPLKLTMREYIEQVREAG